MAKLDYNSINFKNKDIDKMTGKFGNGDPIKNNLAQTDSMWMSHGWTPVGNKGKAKPPKTVMESEANKAGAAQSNPSVTGVSPRYRKDPNTNYQKRSESKGYFEYQGVGGVKPKKRK